MRDEGRFSKRIFTYLELFGNWGMVLMEKSIHNGIVRFKIAVIKV
jgi:hypothetical protein